MKQDIPSLAAGDRSGEQRTGHGVGAVGEGDDAGLLMTVSTGPWAKKAALRGRTVSTGMVSLPATKVVDLGQ